MLTTISDKQLSVDEKFCAPESSSGLTFNRSSGCLSRSCITRACHAQCASTASSDHRPYYVRTSLSFSSSPLNISMSAFYLPTSIFRPSTSLRNRLPLRLSQYLFFSPLLSSSPGGLNVKARRLRDIADDLTLLPRGREKGSAGAILGCLVLDGIRDIISRGRCCVSTASMYTCHTYGDYSPFHTLPYKLCAKLGLNATSAFWLGKGYRRGEGDPRESHR